MLGCMRSEGKVNNSDFPLQPEDGGGSRPTDGHAVGTARLLHAVEGAVVRRARTEAPQVQAI